MTIDSRWLKTDFKQKYFLFCREKEFEIKKYDKSLAQNKNNDYICRIKITEIENEKV